MSRFIDPRQGDIEDDWSSTKHRSLLWLAGSLAIEMSLPKLALALLLLMVIPAVMLGLVPPVAFAWVNKVSTTITSLSTGHGPFCFYQLSSPLGGSEGAYCFDWLRAASGP